MNDDRPLLERLHARLEATADLPLDRTANRWLGEAEAVAADVARGDAPEAAVERRLDQVRTLLSHVEGTGHPEGDAHVEAARALLDELDERDGPDGSGGSDDPGSSGRKGGEG
ncbi:hypothetical protein ACFQPA_08230 [Halomarina halobia]|uniref:DUF8152 domain-containing protein n=1 Tax=Halomarina halobia TaxID=3033386 RepID=A0ABD6ACL6_9EURY|nr:hypothetical protein [Halomarina sp. PSR21]